MKGVHEVPCNTPGTFFKKVGILWQCGCGQVWRLSYVADYEGYARKTWKKIDLTGTDTSSI